MDQIYNMLRDTALDFPKAADVCPVSCADNRPCSHAGHSSVICRSEESRSAAATSNLSRCSPLRLQLVAVSVAFACM